MGLPIIDDHAIWNDYWSQRDNSDYVPGGDLNTLCGQIERGAGRSSVLDIGCGDGRLVQALCAKGVDARGMDISHVALKAAEVRCPSRFTQGSVLEYNPSDCHFGIVTCINCLEYLSQDQIPQALSAIARLARYSFYLTVALKSGDPLVRTLQTREWWETRCFEAGFRRHPNVFLIMPYDEAFGNVNEITLLLEPLPNTLAEVFSIDSLAEERTLHMDMAREAGSRSDAHMMRYHIAAQYIRPGDRVLDAACGLGYGSRMLRHQSLCASVLGIDGSDYAINYATQNYGEVGRVDFQVGFLPEILDTIELGSIDFIASFETLDHLREPMTFLAACRKILSPGGRIMVSVPHDWTEADGKAPNPHHFHIYDWPTLLGQVREYFALEKAFCQTANRRKRANNWIAHGREWKEVDLQDVSNCESEWCLVLAMADPVDATQPYVDRHHLTRSGETVPLVLDFAGQYKNPWLVPSLISIGLRTENSELRLEMASRLTLNDKSADSAAARCVEGYDLLAHVDSPDAIRKWFKNITAHVAQRDWQIAPPIEVRWAISLLYLQALLERKIGEIEGALASFEAITKLPFLRYSPLIATKVVDAYYELGMAAWVGGDGNTAREFFLDGLKTAKIAVTTEWHQAFGPLDKMPRFITSELSEILDLSTRCAVGAQYALSERPTGWIALNVAWNQKFQLVNAKSDVNRIQKDFTASNERVSGYIAEVNSAHFLEVSRLRDVIAAYEEAKRTWFEPQLLELRHEVERLSGVVQSYENAKATWYEPQLLELQHEIEHLNGEVADFRKVRAEWFEPQLESRANRIMELETALLQAQIHHEETERTNRNAFEAERKRLQDEVDHLEGEVKALQFSRIFRTYGARIFSALTRRC